MNNKLIQILALVIVLIAVSACDLADEGSKGVFYEVNNGENELYLFGSVHVGNEDMYPLHSSVEAAFSEADVLGLEIDMVNMSEMEIAEQMAEFGFYSDGKQLTNYVFRGNLFRSCRYLLPL